MTSEESIQLARFEEKIDYLISRFNKFDDKFDNLEGRVREVEQECVCIDDLKTDVSKIQDKVNIWSGINSLGLLIGTYFAHLIH